MKMAVAQFGTFCLIGLVGTAGHFLTLYGLTSSGVSGPLAASAVGAVVGALINYSLNYSITFSSDRRHVETLPRFLALAGTGFGLNYLFMMLLLGLSLHYLLAQTVASGLVLVFNFIGNRLWTFRVNP
ncbi:MAG: GtrA family protein [Proteobacteria bacterium]|nr:GtrA family protein [Pseudomonadota bacterium]